MFLPVYRKMVFRRSGFGGIAQWPGSQSTPPGPIRTVFHSPYLGVPSHPNWPHAPSPLNSPCFPQRAPEFPRDTRAHAKQRLGCGILSAVSAAAPNSCISTNLSSSSIGARFDGLFGYWVGDQFVRDASPLARGRTLGFAPLHKPELYDWGSRAPQRSKCAPYPG